MTTKKGTCKECSKIRNIVARGMCWKCYKDLVPPEDRKKVKRKDVVVNTHISQYPKKIMIPTWECSDGQEFGVEADALRHQLEIERRMAIHTNTSTGTSTQKATL